MMKKMLVAFCILALSSCNFSSGNGQGRQVRCKGPVISQTLELTGFSAIELNGAADIHLSQAPDCAVRVEANEEVFQYIDFHVKDGVLILGSIDNVTIMAEEYDIYVGLPEVTDIRVNGAVDLEMQSGYQSDKGLSIEINGAGDCEFSALSLPSLEIELNGAGDIDAKALQLGMLSIEVNGAGKAEVSGQADKARLSVNGAGSVDARALVCPQIEKQKSGMAVIRTQ